MRQTGGTVPPKRTIAQNVGVTSSRNNISRIMSRIDVMPCVGFRKTLNLGNTISDVSFPPRRLGMNPVKGHHGVRIQVNTIDKGMKRRGDLK